jgi:hypothetical protein
MADSADPDRNKPPPDAVDAEFTDIDNDRTSERSDRKVIATYVRQDHTQNRSIGWGTILWSVVFFAAILGAIIYRANFRADQPAAESVPAPPGWDELVQCTETVSFDGKRQLALLGDNSAELTEDDKDGHPHVTFGKWAFDPSSQKYSTTFNNSTDSYSLFSKDDVLTCILVKGDLASANLLESWFSARDEDGPDPDPN